MKVVILAGGFGTRIIEESHRRYYKPLSEIRALKRARAGNLREPLSPHPALSDENFSYDEI